MAVAVYEVCVDWNNDGDFSDALEDISSEFKTLSYSRGRDSDLDKAAVGMCSIVVKDTTGKYVTENTASPLYGYLLPARPVRVRGTFGGNTYELFNGFLDDIIPYPGKDEREAYLPCVDGFDQLKRSRVTMALQENKKSGQLIGTALDYVSWSGAKRVLDTGQDIYALVHAERQLCLDFCQQLEKSEFGFLYINGSGELCWEDRHHRLLSPHTVSQWTCTASLHEAITPTNSLKSIRNLIVITAQPKAKAGSLSDIWVLQENAANGDSPSLQAGETKVFWAKYADANGLPNIAGEVEDTGANPTTHYAGNNKIDDPPGVDRTGDVSVVQTTFSGSAKLEVQNTGATSLYLTLLKVRGKIYADLGKLVIEAPDSTSQTAYLLRELPIDLPYAPTAAMMQGMADYQLSIKKAPIPGYEVKLINKSDAILTQILARELSDRITLQSSPFNIDAEFHIDRLEHEITNSGKVHRCKWILTRADDYQYWVWDISKWNQTTRWGF